MSNSVKIKPVKLIKKDKLVKTTKKKRIDAGAYDDLLNNAYNSRKEDIYIFLQSLYHSAVPTDETINYFANDMLKFIEETNFHNKKGLFNSAKERSQYLLQKLINEFSLNSIRWDLVFTEYNNNLAEVNNARYQVRNLLYKIPNNTTIMYDKKNLFNKFKGYLNDTTPNVKPPSRSIPRVLLQNRSEEAERLRVAQAERQRAAELKQLQDAIRAEEAENLRRKQQADADARAREAAAQVAAQEAYNRRTAEKAASRSVSSLKERPNSSATNKKLPSIKLGSSSNIKDESLATNFSLTRGIGNSEKYPNLSVKIIPASEKPGLMGLLDYFNERELQNILKTSFKGYFPENLNNELPITLVDIDNNNQKYRGTHVLSYIDNIELVVLYNTQSPNTALASFCIADIYNINIDGTDLEIPVIGSVMKFGNESSAFSKLLNKYISTSLKKYPIYILHGIPDAQITYQLDGFQYFNKNNLESKDLAVSSTRNKLNCISNCYSEGYEKWMYKIIDKKIVNDNIKNNIIKTLELNPYNLKDVKYSHPQSEQAATAEAKRAAAAEQAAAEAEAERIAAVREAEAQRVAAAAQKAERAATEQAARAEAAKVAAAQTAARVAAERAKAAADAKAAEQAEAQRIAAEAEKAAAERAAAKKAEQAAAEKAAEAQRAAEAEKAAEAIKKAAGEAAQAAANTTLLAAANEVAAEEANAADKRRIAENAAKNDLLDNAYKTRKDIYIFLQLLYVLAVPTDDNIFLYNIEDDYILFREDLRNLPPNIDEYGELCRYLLKNLINKCYNDNSIIWEVLFNKDTNYINNNNNRDLIYKQRALVREYLYNIAKNKLHDNKKELLKILASIEKEHAAALLAAALKTAAALSADEEKAANAKADAQRVAAEEAAKRAAAAAEAQRTAEEAAAEEAARVTAAQTAARADAQRVAAEEAAKRAAAAARVAAEQAEKAARVAAEKAAAEEAAREEEAAQTAARVAAEQAEEAARVAAEQAEEAARVAAEEAEIGTPINKTAEENEAEEDEEAEEAEEDEEAAAAEPIGPQTELNGPLPSSTENNQAVTEITKNGNNIVQITATGNKQKLACKLSNRQKIENASKILLSTAFYAITTGVSMTGFGGPIVAGVAGLVGMAPITPSMAMPYGGKNTYYLGYMHARKDCIDTIGNKDPGLIGPSRYLAPVIRSKPIGINDGCFVWSLLTYRDTKAVRIIVFGGNKVREYSLLPKKQNEKNWAAFDASGFVASVLDFDKESGQLYLVLIGQLELAEFVTKKTKITNKTGIRIPIHWQDQVQYVSCGIRPMQNKWHVTVKDGKVINVQQKRETSTNETTVYAAEKPLISKKAENCKVWIDGTFNSDRPASQNILKRAYKNFDYERLWSRSSSNRLQQPEAQSQYITDIAAPGTTPIKIDNNEYILTKVKSTEKDAILNIINNLSTGGGNNYITGGAGNFTCNDELYILRNQSNPKDILAWLCYSVKNTTSLVERSKKLLTINAIDAKATKLRNINALLNNFVKDQTFQSDGIDAVTISTNILPDGLSKTKTDIFGNDNFTWQTISGSIDPRIDYYDIKFNNKINKTAVTLTVKDIQDKGIQEDGDDSVQSLKALSDTLKNIISSISSISSIDNKPRINDIKDIKALIDTHVNPNQGVLDATTQLLSTLSALVVLSSIKANEDTKSITKSSLDSLNNLVSSLKNMVPTTSSSFDQSSFDQSSIKALLETIQSLTTIKSKTKEQGDQQQMVMVKNSLEQLKKLTDILLIAARERKPSLVSESIKNLKDWIKKNTISLNDYLPKPTKLEGSKLAKIKENVLDTLEVLGFEERGDRRFQEIELENSGSNIQLSEFNRKLKTAEKALNKKDETNKAVLRDILQWVQLSEDPFNPNNTAKNYDSLNKKLDAEKLNIIITKSPKVIGGGNDIALESMNQYNLPLTGGALPNLGEYNIRIEGGAPANAEEAKPADNPNSPQKVFEKIQELKIQFNKVIVFIEQEVKPKYNNYNKQVFSKIFSEATENPIATFLKYEPAKTGSKTDEGDQPPKDSNNIVGLYNTIADGENGKNKWLEDIKKKITENRTSLESIKNAYLEICDLPEIKSLNIFPSYKTKVKNAFDGDFGDSKPNETDEEQRNRTTGIITRLDNISKTIQARFDAARSALKPVADGFTSALTSYEKTHQKVYNALGQKIGLGGDGEASLVWTGGAPPADTKDKKDTVESEIDKFLDDNVKRVKGVTDGEIEQVYKRLTNPAFAASATSTPGIWGNLLFKYKTDTFNDGGLIAGERLAEGLKANKLIPSEVLKISSTDRLIFAAVMLFLRALTIQITEYYIAKGTINTISMALIVFTVVYSALFLVLVVYVNLDAYRLRILFNYINLNGNSGVIMMHLGLLYLLTYGIFMIIRNINFPVSKMKDTAVTDEELAYLMYQLEIITTIVWLFLLILVALL